MTYGTRTPIRDELLERCYPLLEELKGSLVVVEYDIQMRTWQQQGTYLNAYALVCVCKGALLGDDNNLQFVWTFGQTPQSPNVVTLRTSIREMFQRIAMMRTRQLQTKPNQQ